MTTENMPSLLNKRPQGCDKLELLKGEIDQVAAIALTQRIGSTETKDAALAVGAQVKRMRKALDDRRKEITGPMQDSVKQVIAFAALLDAPLAKAEDHIRAQAVNYANQIAEKQRIEQARILEEKRQAEMQRQAELKAASAFSASQEEELEEKQRIEDDAKQKRISAAAQERELKSQGVKGTREVWTFEITDPALVPDAYWLIDESLLRNAVSVQKLREIPGLRIYAETKVNLGRY